MKKAGVPRDDIVLLIFQIPLENIVFGKGQLVPDLGISW
jgi:hypothetical protein